MESIRGPSGQTGQPSRRRSQHPMRSDSITESSTVTTLTTDHEHTMRSFHNYAQKYMNMHKNTDEYSVWTDRAVGAKQKKGNGTGEGGGDGG